MAPLFRKTPNHRIFQDLVQQIEEAILDGRLKAGDKLPAERELREMFQTSRGSLREALRVLEQKGLIHIKVGAGGGAVVRNLSIRQVSESLGFLIRYEKISLEELAEFRERVEGDAAALAAKRATNSELEQLTRILKTARACVEKGEPAWEDFLRADEWFHVAMVTSSHNRMYYSVLKMVQDNIHQLYLGTPLRTLEKMKENLDDLNEIFKAVKEKDPARAKIAVCEHIRKFSTYMIRSRADFSLRQQTGQPPTLLSKRPQPLEKNEVLT